MASTHDENHENIEFDNTTTTNGTAGKLDNKTARRPMNAFLIFCKRHRCLVRKKYPDLENRGVTKVLGEWWASLDQAEKESYTQLATQHKEAFMKSHPEFKWVSKAAAANASNSVTAPSALPVLTHPKTGTNFPSARLSSLCQDLIVPGKLADESQLGGLSTLLLPESPSLTTMAVNGTSTIIPGPSQVPKPPKKRYLERSYCTVKEEKPEVTEDKPVPKCDQEPEEECRLAVQCLMSMKGVSSNDPYRVGMWRKRMLHNSQQEMKEVNNNLDTDGGVDEVDGSEDETEGEHRRRGSARACKGQRYRQFMWGSMIQQRRRSTKWELCQDVNPSPQKTRKPRIKKEPRQNGVISKDSFDLETKIDMLPTLSLEEFKEKKRSVRWHESHSQPNGTPSGSPNKEKSRKSSPSASNSRMYLAVKENATVVGSRKRKIRRQSIVRRQPDSSFKDSNLMEISCSDLALKTLAEVAAKKQKIIK